jgi:VanZ family protein
VIQLNKPTSVRRFLAALAVLVTIAVIYASLIPFDYTPLTWRQTWDEWRQIRWLDLKLFQRADWVANALVLLPSGILATAAVGWGRTRRWPVLVAAPIVSLVLVGVVTAIEFVQIWFPTRTKSLNDLAAGYLGAVLGPLIWIAAGRAIERGIVGFVTLPRFTDRLKWLCVGYLMFITVYSVLPLDIVATGAEWRSRLVAVSAGLNPFHIELSPKQITKELVLGAVRMAPLGLLLAVSSRARIIPWVLIFMPIAFELIQVPLYSKHVSLLEISGGWLGGGAGYLLGMNLHRFQYVARQPALWGLAWIVAFFAVTAALLVRTDGIVMESSIIADRFARAWSLPLERYYSGTEYNAYTNMLLKAGVFAILGAASFGWQRTSAPSARRRILTGTLLAVIVAAFGIELLQVILPPLIADMSDGLTYLLGYAAGYHVTRLLWGTGVLSPPCSSAALLSPEP